MMKAFSFLGELSVCFPLDFYCKFNTSQTSDTVKKHNKWKQGQQLDGEKTKLTVIDETAFENSQLIVWVNFIKTSQTYTRAQIATQWVQICRDLKSFVRSSTQRGTKRSRDELARRSLTARGALHCRAREVWTHVTGAQRAARLIVRPPGHISLCVSCRKSPVAWISLSLPYSGSQRYND